MINDTEPLKGKEFDIFGKGQSGAIYFEKKDVASAVEWLKYRLKGYAMTGVNDIINEAFEDVVKK